MKTWLTDRFDLSVPLVGAPMFGVGGGRLAAAISAAGALGMIGTGRTTTPQWLRDEAALAAAGGRPYGIGLMAWALDIDDAVLAPTLEARPALVSVSFGDIGPYVEALHAAGIAVASQAGNLAEAKAAAQAGVDVLVVRGGEAGGHGRNEVSTLPLLQVVLDEVDLPVIAAGGLSGARGLAAVLAAGAVGGWAGTAFLTCVEADTSDEAVARLSAAAETQTAYGRVFDVGQRLDWPPEFGGRALRNDFFDRWDGRESELGDADVAELAAAKTARDFDAAYIYAGQGVGALHDRRAAADVVADFAAADGLIAAAARRLS
ncbi:MAG: nitronate monooxygenase [Frankiaceae bacterium]|nr:nitronate monooxygenase [Frankiaceae bacterium]